jgi:hypothetical protein
MSAGVFPPTSSRSTRPRTSTRTLEFAGYADSMKERCPSGSAPAFLRRRRGRPDRIVGSRGGRGPFSPRGVRGDGSPERRTGRVPDGRPDRPGANDAFACPGTSCPPRAQPRVPPGPRCSVPQAQAALSPSPPAARVLLRSPRSRQRSRGSDPPGRKRAFACGVPGALLGTWVSPTRFDEDERPVSRERLDMRGTHSHEASSWARGYYAE